MNDTEKREKIGIVETTDFVFDALSGKLTILTNSAAENDIFLSVAEQSREILKKDSHFYFRQLINAVEVGPNVTVLPNGIFADSKLKKIIIPARVTTVLGYSMCNSSIDTIVFEGDKISFDVAEGLLSSCSVADGKELINIECSPHIEASLLHHLKLLTFSSEDTVDILAINGKKIKDLTEEEKEEINGNYRETKAELPELMFGLIYYNECPYTMESAIAYKKYLNDYFIQPFYVYSSNFSFDSLTGEFTVTGNKLCEDEVNATMNRAHEELRKAYPGVHIDFDIKELTTSVVFSNKVTACPPTVFGEHPNLSFVELPEQLKHMGINSFVLCGGNTHEFTIVIRNNDFSFTESPKSLNKAGLKSNKDLGPAVVKIYYKDGLISPEDLSWMMPCIINPDMMDRFNVQIFPLSAYSLVEDSEKEQKL